MAVVDVPGRARDENFQGVVQILSQRETAPGMNSSLAIYPARPILQVTVQSISCNLGIVPYIAIGPHSEDFQCPILVYLDRPDIVAGSVYFHHRSLR